MIDSDEKPCWVGNGGRASERRSYMCTQGNRPLYLPRLRILRKERNHLVIMHI